MWFSNQCFGTSKDVRGEGIDGVGVSCIGDLDVSPFSSFVAYQFIFLLGAMEMVFKAWKGKSERDLWEGKQKQKKWVSKTCVSFTIKTN